MPWQNLRHAAAVVGDHFLPRNAVRWHDADEQRGRKKRANMIDGWMPIHESEILLKFARFLQLSHESPLLPWRQACGITHATRNGTGW